MNDPWSTAAPLNVARQEVAVAALTGRVYVVGGLLANGSTSDAVEAWVPGTSSWTTLAPLPVPLHHTTASSVGGRLYVIGGWSDFFATPSSAVLAYDPVANAWSARANLPTARGSPAAAVLDGKIHVLGGWNGGSLGTHEIYDPVTDSWSTAASLPTARNHLGAATADGLLLAVGGRLGLGAGVGNTTAVEAFDPCTGTWSLRAPLPEARGGLAVASLGDLVYAFGGEGNDADPSGVFPDVDAYDATLDVWFPRTPMPTPRHGIGAAPLGDGLHLPGGAELEGFGVTAVHEVYRPVLDVPEGVPALPMSAMIALGLGLALVGALLASRGPA